MESIVYATRGDRELHVDVYRPDTKPKAAVVMVHGGGWRGGSKDMMINPARELAARGFVAVAVEYRLLGVAPWPAQIQDVRSAIRWTRRNAAMLGVDPEKIAIEGMSAGGQLSLLTAGRPDHSTFDHADDEKNVGAHVNAVAAMFAPVEFALEASEGIGQASRLAGDGATMIDARDISPIAHVSAAYPPTYLAHGEADKLVSVVTSLKMLARLREAGVVCELHVLANHTHEFIMVPSTNKQIQGELAVFLDRVLVDPVGDRNTCIEFNMFAKRDAEAAAKASGAASRGKATS